MDQWRDFVALSFNRGGHDFALAEADGDLLGILTSTRLLAEPSDLRHFRIVVDPGWRRRRLASRLLDGSLVVALDAVAAAIRLLVERNRVVAEGAGAASVAAALAGLGGSGKVACVVSGGNIDAPKLARILRGEAP